MNPGDEMELNVERLFFESNKDANETDDTMPNINTNFFHVDGSCSSESDEDGIAILD